MKKIRLPSRDTNNWLEPYKENEYLLKSELSHIRVGTYKDSTDIVFIDPPGGPFMSVGSEVSIEGITKIIESIRHIKGKGFAIKVYDLSSK